MAGERRKRSESRRAERPRRWAAGAPLAVLSDIHGNLRALDAVLGDMERRGVQRAVHLGDAVYGPLDPRGTAARLIERDIPSVRGNEDRLVVCPEGSDAAVDFARAELGSRELEWLGALPPTLALGELLLCHGTPCDDAAYLLLDVASGGVRLRPDGDILSRLAGVEQPVVLCGHDHTPNLVRLRAGTLIVDPGSVGCPAYRDDRPFPHRIECGSPHARYAILTRLTEGWLCEHVAVTYDWDAAAAAALRNGRPDWAFALETGRAAGPPAA